MMKNLLIIALFLFSCFSLYANQPVTVAVAVLDLDILAGVPVSYQAALTDILRENLFRVNSFRVIERNKMDEILTEQGFQLSGCTSNECAIEVGQLLGVQQMIAGSVSLIGEMYTVSLRIIDVETGEVINMQSARCMCTIEEMATNTISEAVNLLVGNSTIIEAPTFNTQSDSVRSVNINRYLPDVKFVVITGGTFMMGSQDDEEGRDNDEGPIHQVTISTFEMMTTEITQEQWQAIINYNPSSYRRGDNLPVEHVSWLQVQRFIQEINQLDSNYHYRLPTEAEWEYACRAGTRTSFYCGNDLNALEEVCWFNRNSRRHSHSVAEKEPNAWGLYDMHGNVWEWCQDSYNENYYSRSPEQDPLSVVNAALRVARGGSWHSTWSNCRSASRLELESGYNSGTVICGFRLVRQLIEG